MPDTSFSPPLSADAAEAVARLALLVVGQRTLDETLDVVADITRDALPGPPQVSITLVDAAPSTGLDGQPAPGLDGDRHHVGERRPDPAPQPRETTGSASMSVPLPVEDRHIGAMTVSYPQADLLDAAAEQTTRSVAGFVAVAVTNADRYERAETLAKQLADALESRAVIDQAKGILIAEHQFSAAEAFARLVRLSQNTNRKLRDVAIALVEHAQKIG